jgi:hypothetical protein
MTIIKKSNVSDIEVQQVTPELYVLTVLGENKGEYKLEDLAVEVIKLKQSVKIPSKWCNELAYVALTHLMNKQKALNEI